MVTSLHCIYYIVRITKQSQKYIIILSFRKLTQIMCVCIHIQVQRLKIVLRIITYLLCIYHYTIRYVTYIILERIRKKEKNKSHTHFSHSTRIFQQQWTILSSLAIAIYTLFYLFITITLQQFHFTAK